jgi:phenylalanyl-tRNA synthetase beta chain
LKGCIENIFYDLKLNNYHFRSEDPEPFLHPGKSGKIYLDGATIGYAGEIHPDVVEKMNLRTGAYIFEMNLDVLADHLIKDVTYKEISRYPAVTRDVAFLIPADVAAENMLDIVLQQKEDLLENVSIFDIYAGKGLPSDVKSLGLRFSYRASGRTLTDAEVNNIHEKIVRNTVQLTGAKIRGE